MTNNIKKLEFLDKFILFITLIYITQMARVENDYGIFFLITYFLLIIFFVIYNFIKKKILFKFHFLFLDFYFIHIYIIKFL